MLLRGKFRKFKHCVTVVGSLRGYRQSRLKLSIYLEDGIVICWLGPLTINKLLTPVEIISIHTSKWIFTSKMQNKYFNLFLYHHAIYFHHILYSACSRCVLMLNHFATHITILSCMPIVPYHIIKHSFCKTIQGYSIWSTWIIRRHRNFFSYLLILI